MTPRAGIWHRTMSGECPLTTPPNLLATKPGARPMVETRYESQAQTNSSIRRLNHYFHSLVFGRLHATFVNSKSPGTFHFTLYKLHHCFGQEWKGRGKRVATDIIRSPGGCVLMSWQLSVTMGIIVLHVNTMETIGFDKVWSRSCDH